MNRSPGPRPATGGDRPPSSPLHDLWEASSLSTFTSRAFGARVQGWSDPTGDGPHRLVGPGPETALRPVGDRLQRLFAARRSRRDFDDRPLGARHLERVLAATGPTPDGRRTVPEAGSLDAVHTYALLRRVEGPLDASVVRYDHRRHSVQHVGPVPDDHDIRALFMFDGGSLPQVVLVFVLDQDLLVAKYGERGGRFALQQVGHAAQNVGLRLARHRLSGYLLGGGLDREVLGALGVAHLGVRYGGAMAVGR